MTLLLPPRHPHARSNAAAGELVRYHKNVLRQYAYVYERIRSLALPQANEWTLASFLTATSIVMTRQNRIPTTDRAGTEMALVPLWDMCNHVADGPLTSYYDADAQHLEATAMRDFAEGDQVYIFYGARTSADFVLYSGFLPDHNPADALKMRFAVPPTATQAAERIQLLRRWGLPPYGRATMVRTSPRRCLHANRGSCTCATAGLGGGHRRPVASSSARVYEVGEGVMTAARWAPLRTFVRVFVLTPDQLALATQQSSGGGAADAEPSFGDANDADVRRYLHTRLSLVLRAYGSTAEVRNREATGAWRVAVRASQRPLPRS